MKPRLEIPQRNYSYGDPHPTKVGYSFISYRQRRDKLVEEWGSAATLEKRKVCNRLKEERRRRAKGVLSIVKKTPEELRATTKAHYEKQKAAGIRRALAAHYRALESPEKRAIRLEAANTAYRVAHPGWVSAEARRAKVDERRKAIAARKADRIANRNVRKAEAYARLRAKRVANKDAILARQRERYHASEEIRRKYAEARKATQEALRADPIALAAHKEKMRHKQQQVDSPRKRERQRTDPVFRCRVWAVGQNVRYRKLIQGDYKKTRSLMLLGCSPEVLKGLLELKFKPGMTWENAGTHWHIDHIIPLCSATTEEEVRKLCHYTNLQPLWAAENQSKGGKMPTAP